MRTIETSKQLSFWIDDTPLEEAQGLIAGFEHWCARIDPLKLDIPRLKPADKAAVALLRVFHELAAVFEERDGPRLRSELKEGQTNDHLTENLVSLRLLQPVIDACKNRGVHVPRGILALRAVIGEHIYSLGRREHPGPHRALIEFIGTGCAGR